MAANEIIWFGDSLVHLYHTIPNTLSKPRWEEGYVVLNSSPFLVGAVLSKLKL